jgi:hypothetical protein
MMQEGIWIGQAIGDALIKWGYFQPKQERPPAVDERASYTCTLRGVSFVDGRLKVAFGCAIDGKRYNIHLGSGDASWEEEQRLHGLWKAARLLYQSGATADEIRRAATHGRRTPNDH